MKQGGFLLRVFQVVWVLVFVTTILLVVAAIPARLMQLSQVLPVTNLLSGTLGTAEAAILTEMGLSVRFFAVYVTFFEALAAIVGIIVGAIIFWRQHDNGMAVFVSIVLVTLSTFTTPLMTAVSQYQPRLEPAIIFLQFIAIGPALLVFFIFPDGRFVPRWTVIAGALWLVYSVSWFIFPEFKPPASLLILRSTRPIVFVLVFLAILVGVYSQVYRYRHVSTPLQRQQTKWVVFGFGTLLFLLAAVAVVSAIVAFSATLRNYLLFLLLAIPFTLVALMVPPIAVMFSILKFRLWDIDIFIRRTVTYALLAAMLGIVYPALIILLQQAFATVSGQRSEVVTVLSTLAIAALFVPLRNWIQAAIDRRFNRKKYDAQKVLSDFANTVRDETDLEKLTARLMQVVDETMQPKSVSVWLKREAEAKKQQ